MPLRRSLLVPVLAGLLGLFPACGGGGEERGGTPPRATGGNGSGAGGTGGEITITAGDLFLKPAQVTAPAGRIMVTYVNEGAQPHTLLVEGRKGLDLAVDKKGDTDKGAIELPPGTYKLYCSVPGHRAAGMEATLTVK